MNSQVERIRILQSFVFQDLLQFEIETNELENRWKSDLEKYLNTKEADRFYANFLEIKELIAIRGLSKLTIQSMDTTAASRILLKCREIFNIDINKDIFFLLKDIVDDRNGISHLNGHESDFELFQAETVSLYNLKFLIKTIILKRDYYKNSDIDLFRVSRLPELDDLFEQVAEDYKDTIKEQLVIEKMEKEIKFILSQPEDKVRGAYNDYLSSYLVARVPGKKYSDLRTFELFKCKCAEKGVEYAYEDAATVSYNKCDFITAVFWLNKSIIAAQNRNSPIFEYFNSVLKLLNIYSNKWDNEIHSEEEIAKLKALITVNNREVISNTSDDGIVQYGWVNKNKNPESIMWSELPRNLLYSKDRIEEFNKLFSD